MNHHIVKLITAIYEPQIHDKTNPDREKTKSIVRISECHHGEAWGLMYTLPCSAYYLPLSRCPVCKKRDEPVQRVFLEKCYTTTCTTSPQARTFRKRHITFSLSESRADVASSSRRIAGSLMIARAMAMRCNDTSRGRQTANKRVYIGWFFRYCVLRHPPCSQAVGCDHRSNSRQYDSILEHLLRQCTIYEQTVQTQTRQA